MHLQVILTYPLIAMRHEDLFWCSPIRFQFTLNIWLTNWHWLYYLGKFFFGSYMAMFIRFCEPYSSFHLQITQNDSFPDRKASLKVDFKCKHSAGKPWHLCVRSFRTQCTCHNPFLSLSNSFLRSSSILLKNWNVSRNQISVSIPYHFQNSPC